MRIPFRKNGVIIPEPKKARTKSTPELRVVAASSSNVVVLYTARMI